MTNIDISLEAIEQLRASMRVGHSSTVDAERMILALSAALTQSRAETAAVIDMAVSAANKLTPPFSDRTMGESIVGASISKAIRDLATPDQSSAIEALIAETKAGVLGGPWEDKPDALTDAVHAAHPVFTKDYKTYDKAMELVSNRHGKGALVGLVNYLISQNKSAEARVMRKAAKLCDKFLFIDEIKEAILAAIPQGVAPPHR